MSTGGLRPLTDLLSLAGRVAVVTGGAGAIGRACAFRLAEAGAVVVIADLEAGPDTARQIGVGPAASVVSRRTDVTSPDEVAALARYARDGFGSLDIWVNGAGIYPTSLVSELSPPEFRRIIDLNLTAAFYGMREAAAIMTAARRGVIVNIESTAAFRPRLAGAAAYVASKHGLHGLTQALAVELGPSDVRVLGVAPAMVADTPVMQAAAANGDAGAAVAAGIIDRLPIKRLATPDDVACAVLFCASDLSAYCTGSSVLVDGGLLSC